MLLFHFQCPVDNGPLAGPVPTDMVEREVMDSVVGAGPVPTVSESARRFDSVGLLLDITVDDSQWTSLFRIVRASFRG